MKIKFPKITRRDLFKSASALSSLVLLKKITSAHAGENSLADAVESSKPMLISGSNKLDIKFRLCDGPCLELFNPVFIDGNRSIRELAEPLIK